MELKPFVAVLVSLLNLLIVDWYFGVMTSAASTQLKKCNIGAGITMIIAMPCYLASSLSHLFSARGKLVHE